MDASGERDDVATQAAPTLGQVLQNARTARALSIEQLATELRIEAAQLAALEQNEFDRIGPPVFVKGYMKQYGQRLGLDYRDLLGMYYAQVETREVVIQPSRTIKLRDERQITVWIIAAVVLAVLVAALAVWWIGNGRPLSLSSDENVGAPRLPDPAAARAAAPNAAPSAPAASDVPSEATDAAALFAAAAAAAKSASRVPRAGEPAGLRLAQAEVSVTDEASGAADAVPTAAEPSSVTRAAARAGTVRLTLAFNEESWAEVTAGDGERLFYGLAAAGRRAELAGAPPFDVVLGNAGEVSLWVNGEEQPIPRRRGNLARFRVNVPASSAD